MMEEPHPNVKVILTMLDAFNRRDKEAMDRCVSEDVVYTIYGKGPFAGVYRGIDDINRVLELGAKIGLNVKPLLVLTDGEYVFILGKLTGKREGKTLETENCYLYRIRDGKLAEGRNIPTDQYAFDEYCR